MTSDNLPAVAQRRDPVPSSYAEAMTVGATLAKSGFFTDAREESQAAAKVIAGMELGIGPMAAMAGIYIVKGKVTLGSNLIGGQIKRSGRYDFRVTRLDDTGCVIDFYDRGEQIGTSSFTEADAKAAGLWGGQGPWKQHPRNMLYARAMSNGAKWFTPDVFAGPVYTPDEMGAEINAETGEVLSVPTVTVGEPVPTPDPEPDPAVALGKERYTALVDQYGAPAVSEAARKAGAGSSKDLADDAIHKQVADALDLHAASESAANDPAVIDAQGMRKVHAKAKDAGLDHDAIHALALELFEGIESTKQVPADQLDSFLDAIETRGAELAKAAA